MTGQQVWRQLYYGAGPLAERPNDARAVGYLWLVTDVSGGRWSQWDGKQWAYMWRGLTQQPMPHTSMHIPGGSSDLSGTYALEADLIGVLPDVGTVKSVQATVDFGFPTGGEGDVAVVTVAALWVQAESIIVCSPAGVSTADHDPQDAVAEGITAQATNVVQGVSFDVQAEAPNGSWGRYVINAIAA